jgi:hypothetical protein
VPDKFKLTPEQHKKAVKIIQYCLTTMLDDVDYVHAIDEHDAGATVYINNPESSEAWRFLVTPLGPGQTEL